eukprot:SAG11_NODE_2366_length_3456_cov_1.596068_8_plen_155_part_00
MQANTGALARTATMELYNIGIFFFLGKRPSCECCDSVGNLLKSTLPNVVAKRDLRLPSVVGQAVALVRFLEEGEDKYAPWNYFTAAFFGGFMTLQLWPMVKMSINEWVYQGNGLSQLTLQVRMPAQLAITHRTARAHARTHSYDAKFQGNGGQD